VFRASIGCTCGCHGQRAPRPSTKPVGSLGRLEEVYIQIAGMKATHSPSVHRRAIVVFVADHGVAKQGVSAYSQDVTSHMLGVFDSGHAAINVIAELVNAEIVVCDVGVLRPPTPLVRVKSKTVALGTKDITVCEAMSEDELISAIEVGWRIVAELAQRGLDLIVFGEMGIGNTTSASAITAVMCDRNPSEVTGRGAGLPEQLMPHKVNTVQTALAYHHPNKDKPLDVLRALGGLEIASIVGGLTSAAHYGIPILVDGFIAGAAALVAVANLPDVRDYLIAGHLSSEPGHRIQLDRLELNPLLRLDLRLGEGTGAALAIPILDVACQIPLKMMTFTDVGMGTLRDGP